MKNFKLLFFTLFCILIISSSFSQDEMQKLDYFATYISINIDGNFDEWDSIKVKKIPLNTKQKIEVFQESSTINSNINDCIASFRCISDIEFIYIALSVIDDKFLYGETVESKKDFWNDDCVELTIDGDPFKAGVKYDRQDDADIKIYLNSDKQTTMFGEVAGLYQLPTLFWRAIGVEAVILENENGYQMEARIPCHILGVNQFENGKVFGLNIAVNDDDDGKFRDNKFCWSNDLNDQSYFNPQVLRKCQLISKSEQISPESSFIKKMNVKINNVSDDKINITLTEDNYNKYLHVNVLQDINLAREYFNKDTSLDQTSLLSLVILLNQEEWHEESENALLLLRSKAETEPLIYQEFIRLNKLVSQYMNANNLFNADAINKEFRNLFGEKILYDGIRYIANNAYMAKDFEKAIHFHEKILEFSPDKINEAITYYDLGLSNLYLRDFIKAISDFSKCVESKNFMGKENIHHIVFAYYNLGLSYLRTGNKKKALEVWEELINEALANEDLYLGGEYELQNKKYFITESMYLIAHHSMNSDSQRFDKYTKLIKNKFPESNQSKRLNNILNYAKYSN